MGAMATVGLDLAKNVFQVHGVDADGKVLVRRQLRRGDVLKFFEDLPSCLSGWKPVPPPIIGRGRYRPSGIR
jgi:transposase